MQHVIMKVLNPLRAPEEFSELRLWDCALFVRERLRMKLVFGLLLLRKVAECERDSTVLA